jgi:gamma-glutamyltranspeptidase/glutathione hydrolase
MESILNVVEYGMNVKQAVSAPRIHMQWYPDEIFAEPSAFVPSTQIALEKVGYKVKRVPYWGDVAAIDVDPKTGLLESANAPRYPAGSSAGY